jgi:hypothetical protein
MLIVDLLALPNLLALFPTAMLATLPTALCAQLATATSLFPPTPSLVSHLHLAPKLDKSSMD